MSYTTLDGLGDTWREGDTASTLAEALSERGYAIIRVGDWDALVEYASRQWSPTEDAAWDEEPQLLLALANHRDERRDWVPS